ncbi:MAG: DUF3185 domain-containing protein [Gammaproteobacteria bacterium RIFCSPHIGHO2_12_FULL_37_14]|nr:MAG: DUF3185 domain-containing protein [Gammaproteobacteria bacterium RIFCSPHIGHO2_12_FULL_37_14]
MKSTISFVGIVLIIIGIVGYSYKYFTYTTNEKVAEIGSIQVTTEQEKAIIIPPALSGLSLAAGIILVIIGISRKS